MRYCDVVSVGGAAGGLANTHVFSASGLYDPDITGTGHQPLGFDEWLKFYEHYKVLSAKITCNFMNESSTDTYVAGIGVRSDVTTTANADLMRERGESSWTYIGRRDGGNNSKKLSRSVNCRKFLGIKDFADRTDVQGASNSNPSEGVYFHVWVSDAGGQDAVASLSIPVTIEYTVLLTEPRSLQQS